jgi:hypothetical protein
VNFLPISACASRLAMINTLSHNSSITPFEYQQFLHARLFFDAGNLQLIVKKRIKMCLVTVKKFFVKGTAADFKGKSQNTSYIERLNLTLRQKGVIFAKKNNRILQEKNKFHRQPLDQSL